MAYLLRHLRRHEGNACSQGQASLVESEDPASQVAESKHASEVPQPEEAREQASQVEPVNDAPPDGGYGWICVLSVFLVNCFTWGAAAQSYGVFLAYYLRNNLYPEATAIDYAFIGGFNLAMAMLIAPFVTITTRWWGTHIPMVLGIVLQTSGFVLASWSDRIWQLYLTQGMLVGFGVGFTYVPSIPIISQWFDKKRSFANGIALGGSGVGGLIFSFATHAMIEGTSLPWALRLVGILSGVMNGLATLMVRNRNKVIKPTLRGLDWNLLRRPTAILLLSWVFVTMFGYVCLLYSLPDFAGSIGLNAQQAAYISVFVNVGTAIGRPAIGFASDKFGRIETAATCTLICGVATFAVWLPCNSYGVLIFFAILGGGVLGIVWGTIGPLCVEVAGLVHLQSLLSLCFGISVVPLACAEVIALELRRPQLNDSYLYAQIFAGVSYMLASGIMLALWVVQKRVNKASRTS